ncbi:TetR/AcrR family transcriptional regulator [Streptomyces purpurascens]|uniref:TetR family transcriptional regulator n=1 Tax=Streptomyces purpurascens TaxID=1924 RepID=A0ABZ1MYC3_STREF|nr:TetR family transcriptional regulator [Streptomyces purpurascens]MCE7052285.1 TetR family transcriptional regulator [Streptomyces purpurascens]GHA55619.1 TetR family transcriptional regulator [Streptomyces purpurascens]
MARNAKRQILDGALDLLRTEGGGAITLDAAARQAGLTKPGLMYHFPTKEALMLAVVDHVADRWETLLLHRLARPLQTASPHQRIRAYVEVALAEPFDRADFAIYSDAHYRDTLTDTWVRRFEPWLALPDTLADAARARLTAARLLADGYWTAAATGVFPIPDHDRAQLLALAEDLLKDETS